MLTAQLHGWLQIIMLTLTVPIHLTFVNGPFVNKPFSNYPVVSVPSMWDLD